MEHLGAASADELLVACADKLYNARSILRDFRRLGEEVFDRFTADKEATRWYYRSVSDAFSERQEDDLIFQIGRVRRLGD